MYQLQNNASGEWLQKWMHFFGRELLLTHQERDEWTIWKCAIDHFTSNHPCSLCLSYRLMRWLETSTQFEKMETVLLPHDICALCGWIHNSLNWCELTHQKKLPVCKDESKINRCLFSFSFILYKQRPWCTSYAEVSVCSFLCCN